MSLIELRPNKEKYIPILFCEYCHMPIRSVNEAMLFNDPDHNKYMVCHKRTCDPGWPGSLEFRDILAQIVNNYMGVKMKITPEGFSELEVKPLQTFQSYVNNLEK